jgi:hypothetical protein
LTVGMILYIMVEIFDRRHKKKGFNLHETTGYNICALSKHIDNMCMRLRNGGTYLHFQFLKSQISDFIRVTISVVISGLILALLDQQSM